MKLNIGAGDHPLPGWWNTDINPCHPSIMQLDASKRFPFNDEIFERVFSEHMIEHVPYAAGLSMLRECYRVLEPGGRIRISTPNLDFLIDLKNRQDDIDRAYVEWACGAFNPGEPVCATNVFNNFVRAWGHQFIYDRVALSGALLDAGFIKITSYGLQQSDDSEFRNLENESRMPPGFLALETMTLEGEKPV